MARITESKIRKIIRETVEEYDRAYEIQQAKAELGKFMKGLINKYQLKNAEQKAVLGTIMNYFCPSLG